MDKVLVYNYTNKYDEVDDKAFAFCKKDKVDFGGGSLAIHSSPALNVRLDGISKRARKEISERDKCKSEEEPLDHAMRQQDHDSFQEHGQKNKSTGRVLLNGGSTESNREKKTYREICVIVQG